MSDESVTVVGAGTVGLVTALGLAQAGVSVRVLEAATAPVTAPRDMIYHWSVLPAFQTLGILGDATAAGLINDRWNLRVRGTGESIDFDLRLLADEQPHPYNLHVGQAVMTRLLLAALDSCADAAVEWGTTVTDLAQDGDGVTVMAEGPDGARTYRCGWVIGADGARSVVRRTLGLAFAGSTWPERFVASNLRFDLAQLGFDFASYQIDQQYGALIAKVDDSGLWRYTYAESRLLPETSIDERLRPILAAVLPPDVDPLLESSLPYRIHQRSADRFRVGRMLLVGDAAHLTNPANAAGMTSGLFDAFALIEVLPAVLGSAGNADLLDRYSLVRHRNFWDFTSPTSSQMKEFVFGGDPIRIQDELARHREIVADPDRQRDFLRTGAGCATPSLLSVSADV